MAYSTIKRKKCKSGCGKNTAFGFAGWCFSCAPQEIKDFRQKKTIKQQKQARQRLQRNVMALKVSKETNKEAIEQELWYLSAWHELAKDPHCQNCGDFIPERFYRAATAHILPKRKEYGLPSVATHPANRLFLGGACGCHHKTHRWDTFSQMKVWPLAVKAFLEMFPFIADEEKKNIPEILLQAQIAAQPSGV